MPINENFHNKCKPFNYDYFTSYFINAKNQTSFVINAVVK